MNADLIASLTAQRAAKAAARHRMDRYVIARRTSDLERKGLIRRIEWGAKQIRWEPVT